MKRALVCGAGGFIGSHLTRRLKRDGWWVRGVDLKHPEFSESEADEFVIGDLSDPEIVEQALDRRVEEVYQLAADMGGAGYIFTGDNDASIMSNSAIININILRRSLEIGIDGVFYSSSACVYPEFNQADPKNPNCEENSAYPAQPDSEYGWEKLFSERLYLAYNRNFGMRNKIARYHNIFGPEGTWVGGKEKVPAALCRKIAEAEEKDTIEVWGDGNQTRSFLFIDECVEGTLRLMRSDTDSPVNLGSEQLISINELAKLIISISKKNIDLNHVDGPLGVRGRRSQNDLIKSQLDWAPKEDLFGGLESTYQWILKQVNDR